jgi:biopolymer transport protein ExbD
MDEWIHMPVGNPPPVSKPPEVVTIDVDFDGTVLWNGVALDDGALQGKLQTVAGQAEQPEVHLRPNKLVGNEQFIQ